MDFGPERTDEAAAHLMSALCQLGKAQNATWIGAVRVGAADDALGGWRVPKLRELHEAAPSNASERTRALQSKWERRSPDPAFLHSVRGAGAFRHHTLRRAMPAEWFFAEHWTRFYAAAGVHDALFVGFPLNPDAESHFAFVRVGVAQPFDDDDIAVIVGALRGIKWFHRTLMLCYGLLAASAPLAPAERAVTLALLSDASEKEVAASVGMTLATTHQYVKAVYRKFGVRSRAGLMRLWTGGRG